MPTPNKTLSMLCQKDKEIERNRPKRSSPTNKWADCFKKKFKGSLVNESENWMDAVATANNPKKQRNINRPNKIRSNFFKSGKEKIFSKKLVNIFYLNPDSCLNFSPLFL